MDKEKNFDFFMNTIKTLARSQGLYSRCFNRILSRLEGLKGKELKRLKADLPQFKDALDVIFYLECF